MSAAPSADCVKVAVRVRPFVPSEITRGCLQIIEKSPDLPQLTVTGESYSKTQDAYAFNNVFMPEETQEEVYQNSVEPIIGKLFEGYNVTILAYGQTGSGKTYTMGTCFEGNWDSPRTGIIPRALKDIFTKVSELEANHTITLSCNFMELYQENLYDLLSGKIKDQSVCEIREDSKKGIIITGLTDMPMKDATAAAKYLMEGGENRSVGATAMNNVSSRSHAIFTVNFKIVGPDGSTIKAKFHLVDLAGSERSKKTKATGTRFKEGVKINQGLLALGNVISALGGGQGTPGGFISYRDSKLTRLLQDSLGGNSVTLMIACVSPADYNIEETLSTLRYADRAKKIKNKPVKNQDSNEQEIGRLKAMVRDLQMKLLVPDDPAFQAKGAPHCGDDCIKEKAKKDSENFKLRQQLSNLVTCVNGLQALHVIEETFYNELVETFQKLRDLLENTCQAEFTVPDTKIFEEINALTKEVADVIEKFRQQADETKTEEDYKFGEGNFEDEASKQKMKEYTNLQMAALKEIKTLEREMRIKQELLDKKAQTAPFLYEENAELIAEYKTRIEELELEVNGLRSSSSSSTDRRDQNATKVNMNRKHKLEKSEKELEECRKRVRCLENTVKFALTDKKRVDDLKKEIQEMKSARVALIRQQRSDSDLYKKWIRSRDKEINILKEKGKKAQHEMKRMERMHEKQQSVLKRKVEEAKAVNKRLQDAMDRNKKVQASRQSAAKPLDKTEVVQTYLDQEFEGLMSVVDAKCIMQNLMKDRGTLNERLINLQSTVNKTEQIEAEIKQLEEDLEMRNVQIADISAKIIQFDVDSKVKKIPDNFASIPELKIAMSYALRAIVESREDFTVVKTKAEDLKISYEQSEERIEALSDQIEKMKKLHEIKNNKMERDFETKLTYLCMKEATNVATNLDKSVMSIPESQRLAWLAKHLGQKCDENDTLRSQIVDLQDEIEALREAKSGRGKKRSQETFTIDNENNPELFSDSEDDFDFNDSFRDPDWRKTPAGKRLKTRRTTHALMKESLINRLDGTGILANISETSDTSNSKRSLNGEPKCKCKGSCATKLCGCKKNGIFCMDSCQCSEACVNLPDNSKESEGADGSGEAAEKENEEIGEVEDSPKRAKLDFNNITTPYYPYQAKKRKPLLKI